MEQLVLNAPKLLTVINGAIKEDVINGSKW